MAVNTERCGRWWLGEKYTTPSGYERFKVIIDSSYRIVLAGRGHFASGPPTVQMVAAERVAGFSFVHCPCLKSGTRGVKESHSVLLG